MGNDSRIEMNDDQNDLFNGTLQLKFDKGGSTLEIKNRLENETTATVTDTQSVSNADLEGNAGKGKINQGVKLDEMKSINSNEANVYEDESHSHRNELHTLSTKSGSNLDKDSL